MKKFFNVFFVVFAAVIFLSSCKKDWTCKCTYKAGGESMTYEFEIKDQTKKDAEKSCESYTIVGASELKCELQ